MFLAEHRFALASQVRELLGVSDDATVRRLRALAGQGFIARRRVFDGQPACCQIRRLGLAAIGSELPPPRLKLAYYEHDVGLAWIWLAAQRGAFGPVRDVIGERRLRSRDGRLTAEMAAQRDFADPLALADEPLGVRLGGVGRRGHERLHYPDLLIVTHEGKRIAVELELSPKGRARLEGILLGFASDLRIDAVLYLVEDRPAGRALGERIQGASRRLGLDGLVAVRRLRVNRSAPREDSGTRRPVDRNRRGIGTHPGELTGKHGTVGRPPVPMRELEA